MKTNLLLLSILVLLISCNDKLLYHLTFNEAKGLTLQELVAQNSVSVKTLKKSIELVPGISNNGLRTDGYSTYIESDIDIGGNQDVSISSWFALETYPTEMAGFFAIGMDSLNCVSVGLNQFGEPNLIVEENGKISRVESSSILPKFEWVNICLSVSNAKMECLVNGKVVCTTSVSTNFMDKKYTRLLIGKNFQDLKIGPFPTNYINGIIDEFKIYSRILDEKELLADRKNSMVLMKPNLNIPESRFANDFNRPKYHILPAANWTNETHGLIYYKNRYHIFNQKNGANVYLGRINWGHFSSSDLVTWTEHRPVLSPEKGYDQYGIWSGHAVLGNDGVPKIMYTGGNGNEFGMCLASPKDDELLEWEKYEHNPVVQGPPEQFGRKDFRDPYLWKEGDIWYMMVGFGQVKNEVPMGTLLLYKSENLTDWVYLHPLFTGNPEVDGSGVFWEMPVLWKMNGKYILMVNPIPFNGKPAVCIYWTGDFVNEKFIPDHKIPKKLEVINRMLSPSVCMDENGQTTAIAIIPDLIHPQLQMIQGWTHLYSIPRIWDLKDGYIHQKPHPSLEKLRCCEKNLLKRTIVSGKELQVISGKYQFEFKCKLDAAHCDLFGFYVCRDEGKNEETKIIFDLNKGELRIDKQKSSLRSLIGNKIETGKLSIDKSDNIELQIFLDGSVLEGFINGKDAFTTRIFPQGENSTKFGLFVDDGILTLTGAKVWELKSSNNYSKF